jgi:hypothetical protein
VSTASLDSGVVVETCDVTFDEGPPLTAAQSLRNCLQIKPLPPLMLGPSEEVGPSQPA